MSREGIVQREIWLELGSKDCRLFRLNTGRAWLSNLGPRGVHRLKDGSVHVEAARSIAMGFARPNGDPVTGTSDLIGWTPVVVTPEMVGQTLAVFTAVETKRTSGGRASDDQKDFIRQVVECGGIAGVANSADAAQAILASWHARF